MILYFIHKYFHDHDNLVTPINPLQTNTDVEAMEKLFVGETYKDDYKILNTNVREAGLNIPPLINAYMNLSPSMLIFGTAINDEFGDVEESGILITIEDIFEDKKQRHIYTFKQ
jgi:hypothetical protein